MAAEEGEVSVLIPAFGRRQMTLGAVRCSLATGAGEVLVSLDTDPDGLEAPLQEIRDRRLRVVVQERQLGLWPNHLALLRLCRLPYVKFLQTDDRLLPRGLRRLCDEMTRDTAIVSGLPYYSDLDRGETWRIETGSTPGRWSSSEYLLRAAVSGNELGRPSYTLLRRQYISTEERYWRDDVSADWLMNLAAAAQGEVAIVAHGTVVGGVHLAQDGATQSFRLVTRRLRNTIQTMASFPDSRFRPIVSAQACAALLMVARNAVGTLRRGKLPVGPGTLQDVMGLARLTDSTMFSTREGRRTLRAALEARHAGGRRVPVPDLVLPREGLA